MNLSIIIPYINDEHVLSLSLPTLLKSIKGKEAEIIILDNSRFNPLRLDHEQVRVINNHRNVGVGMSFNQGVGIAKSCNIVLMGADVIPQPGWYDTVIKDLEQNNGTIYNCVSSGFSDGREPFNEKSVRRYGAFLLYKVEKKDLPTHSHLHNDPKFSKILQAKWNYRDPDPEHTHVPIRSLLGAFYWMRKEDFQKLRGWNGHRMWGSLEPFLSIKARAHGMQIVINKDLDAAHYYGRSPMRPARHDLQFYNMLFMAYTMFSDALREELIWHLRYGGREEKIEKLNVNQAMKMIKRDHGLVQAERDYNNKHFKHGLISNWDRFNTEML